MHPQQRNIRDEHRRDHAPASISLGTVIIVLALVGAAALAAVMLMGH